MSYNPDSYGNAPRIDAPPQVVRDNVSAALRDSKSDPSHLRDAISGATNLLNRPHPANQSRGEDLRALPFQERLALAKALNEEMKHIEKTGGFNIGEGSNNRSDVYRQYKDLQASLFSDAEKADAKTFGQICAAQHNLSPYTSHDGQNRLAGEEQSPKPLEVAAARSQGSGLTMGS